MIPSDWHVASRRFMGRLSGYAAALWLTLAEMTLGVGQERIAISESRLREHTGCARRTLQSLVARLEAYRLVEVDRSRRPMAYRCLGWRDWAWGDDLAAVERLVAVHLVGHGATVHGVALAEALRRQVANAGGPVPSADAVDATWRRWIVTCSRLYRHHTPSTWDGLWRWLPESFVEVRLLAQAGLDADQVLRERAALLVLHRSRAIRLGLSSR